MALKRSRVRLGADDLCHPPALLCLDKGKIQQVIRCGVEQIAAITREAELAAENISKSAAHLSKLAGELDTTASWFKS